MSMRAVLILCVLLTAGCAGAPTQPVAGDIAAQYAAAGRFDEAAREIDIAVRTRPRDLTLRRQAATIHDRAGNPARAIGHLEMATRLSPRDGTIWLELADREEDRDNVADAYVAYRRASSLQPNDLRAVAGLARTADALGFSEEAEAAHDRGAALEREIQGQ